MEDDALMVDQGPPSALTQLFNFYMLFLRYPLSLLGQNSMKACGRTPP